MSASAAAGAAGAGGAPPAVSAPSRPPASASERMCERLADALWTCLEESRLTEVSVGDVIAAAGVSRGTFYYHFACLDQLVAWALRRELLDIDHEGHSLADIASCEQSPVETPALSTSCARVCLLLNRGGMSSVYEVVLEDMLRLWSSALCPEGQELPDAVVEELEYAVGGTVGMLARAGASSDAKRRSSLTLVHRRNLKLVRSVAEIIDESPREVLARLERAQG